MLLLILPFTHLLLLYRTPRRTGHLSLMGLLGGEDLDRLVEGRDDRDTALLVEVDDLLSDLGDVCESNRQFQLSPQKA